MKFKLLNIYPQKAFTFLFCILLFIGHPFVYGQKAKISLIGKENALAISYNNIPRLSGGIPLVENVVISKEITASSASAFTFGGTQASVTIEAKHLSKPNMVGLYISAKGLGQIKGNAYQGVFFSAIPGYDQGVSFYRYKPWNSWTKPVKINSPAELATWDNQCFYWKYKDGVYGVAIPINDKGYRTTLGSEGNMFGSKALAYVDGHQTDTVPAMVIGFGEDLHQMMREAYEAAMELMGTPENLVKNKIFPEPLNYIGWCTWNASSKGTDLNENTVVKGVASFTDQNFPLGWVLIDDGWFNHQGSQLRSLKPDTTKFPRGFKPLITKLKQEHRLKHVGVWHAMNGYWNGIDFNSPLGQRYQHELFSWSQKERVDIEASPVVTYHFIKPTSDSLLSFYRSWHAYLKGEGFSFIKVDNQLVVERMSVGNYPIGQIAKAMHGAMNRSAAEYFDNALINCMNMTSDAYFNFGATPVARSVEDYFPYEEGENYNLERGNAAAHILQGIYNNLYFSPMVYPDLDMFQSHNPNGEFHAIARALNNGPIYVTDNVGEQNFKILKKLVYSDGRIIRADHSLLPSVDCLFQVQDHKPFKAFSKSNGIGLLGIWNCADADQVKGTFGPDDVPDLAGQRFALYEHFSGTLRLVKKGESLPVSLKRMGYQLYYMAPLKNGMTALGLVDKYNAPATLAGFEVSRNSLKASVKDAGVFGAVLPAKPKFVTVNGKAQKEYSYEQGLFKMDVTRTAQNDLVEIKIEL